MKLFYKYSELKHAADLEKIFTYLNTQGFLNTNIVTPVVMEKLFEYFSLMISNDKISWFNINEEILESFCDWLAARN